MLRYSAPLQPSRLAKLIFFLPFVLLSWAGLWHTISLLTLAYSATILLVGLVLALRLKPKYQMILFDDVGEVILQGETEYCGQMQMGCQVWPWLLLIRLANKHNKQTLLVYADGINAGSFRRLARVINLNQLSY